MFLLVPYLTLVDTLMGFDWLLLSGAAEIVQLLCEGESQPATVSQAGNEHFECHAGNSKLGKELRLQMMQRVHWQPWVEVGGHLRLTGREMWVLPVPLSSC